MKNQSFFKTHTMQKLLHMEWWIGYFYAVAGFITSFLVPIQSFLVLTVFLVVLDLFTGTRAAKKRGDLIRSRGLSRTVEKILLYFAAILATEAMRVVFMPPVPLAYVTAFAIGVTEFKSNIENVEAATGVNIWHYLKEKLNLK